MPHGEGSKARRAFFSPYVVLFHRQDNCHFAVLAVAALMPDRAAISPSGGCRLDSGRCAGILRDTGPCGPDLCVTDPPYAAVLRAGPRPGRHGRASFSSTVYYNSRPAYGRGWLARDWAGDLFER